MHQRFRLAGAGAGENEQRPINVYDRRPLLGIQPTQVLCTVVQDSSLELDCLDMDDFSWRKRRILVVEDDAPVRDLLVRVLTDAGYIVTSAKGGEEAMGLARQSELDMLVTDLVMRGMNGVEIAQKLREWKPNLLVLFTSSFTPEQVKGGQLPANAQFIEKPWLPVEMVERIRAMFAEAPESPPNS